MFYCICIGFSGLTLSSLWKVNDSYNENVIYDAAIILVPVICPGDTKPIGDAGYNFKFSSTTNRLSAGIAFVKSGHAKSLLFGNWPAKKYDEGAVIRKFAEYQGLKEDEIKIYGDIRRTLDEVNGVKIFLEKNKYKNLLLITSEMHMRRALALFNRVGIFPDTYSVEKDSYEVKNVAWNDFIPTFIGVKRVEGFLYELFAYVGYYLKGNL